jgi:hypothetical protein
MNIRNTFLILLLVLVGFVSVNAEDAAPAHTNAMADMSYPMQKSMDPQVWMKMSTMMMDPAKATSMENCALCHEGEDLARYTKDFGPMMEPMQKMGQAMSPHQMLQQMNPMMGGMGGSGGMGNMMNPMSMMMNPMSMMNPMMGMMGPMMSMMGPMMNPMMMGGMMGPMMGMMNPMSMMGGGMGGMNPMSMMGGGSGGGMNPMSMMGGSGGMNPMGMMGGANNTGGGYNNADPMSGMMKPEQYTDWFDQMMKQFTPAEAPASK